MYKWQIGEACVFSPVDDRPGLDNHVIPIGTITYVTELDDPSEWPEGELVGLPIHVFGEPYAEDEWSDGADFRPLNEDDYKRIREKHAEPIEFRSGASFLLEELAKEARK